MTSTDEETTRTQRLKAVSDPLRVQVVALMCFGPGPGAERTWTAKELGAELGRDPNVLYHHLSVLEDAGFVVEDGVRPIGGRRERAYRGVPDVMIQSDRTDPDGVAAYLRAILEQAKWGVDAAVQSWPASEARGEVPLHATVNGPGFATTHEEVMAFQRDLMDLVTTYRRRARDARPPESIETGIAPEGWRYMSFTWALYEKEIPYHLFEDMPGGRNGTVAS
ncbi:MAG TPA: winged helix-turn-helix domain-containing protein [Acidimicrobiales bacterium]|nr:winged helix-turn-helix domain-containing protein [Acidimicrobiales bacterium]